MKKVNNIFSSVCNNFVCKKTVAVLSAAVIVFSAMAITLHYTAETTASAKSLDSVIDSQKILELSESFLSPNAVNNISVLEVSDLPSEESESEYEPVVLIEELSTGGESNSEEETQEVTTIESTTETTTVSEVTTTKVVEEVTTKAPVTTTKAPVTTTKASVTTTKAQEVTTKEDLSKEDVAANAKDESSEKIGYSFAELGIKQMSDIPVPDSIRFDKNGIPLNYRYTLSGKSTTYNVGTTTATGTRVHPGVVAVNPKKIPYGTKMYIVASDGSGYVYGYASAEDTGGFIHWKNGPLVDLYVSTMDDVYYWANKPVTIYIF